MIYSDLLLLVNTLVLPRLARFGSLGYQALPAFHATLSVVGSHSLNTPSESLTTSE